MILLLCGGGGSEHNISILSANFFEQHLQNLNLTYKRITLLEDFLFIDNENTPYLFEKKKLINKTNGEESLISFIIPCIHGPPAENGAIQSFFDLLKIPYMGSGSETSILCFNKISTKLWALQLKIDVAPFEIFYNHDENNKNKAIHFYHQYNNDIFIKATHQGSSIGIYHPTTKDQFLLNFEEAFKYSPYVMLEKTIKGRELELAVFFYNDEIQVAGPGEISTSGDNFYTFDQKYSEKSHTKTLLKADGIPNNTILKMHNIAKSLYLNLKIKDLARIDFFLEGDQIYLNEINTFPGHTQISMFPLLLEDSGINYMDYLSQIIKKGRK